MKFRFFIYLFLFFSISQILFGIENLSVTHNPPLKTMANKDLNIELTTNNIEQTNYILLFYAPVSDKNNWKEIEMQISNNKFIATIPGYDIQKEGIFYYIKVYDMQENQHKGFASKESPHFVMTYEDKNISNNKNNNQSGLEDELALFIYEGDIVVSATGEKQKISEAPAVITNISSALIKDRGYRTVAEALQSIPGVDLLNDHLFSNIGVRGVNGGMRSWSRIVKVMIDGQPISFRSNSVNWLDEELIPIEVVDRIEIIRGPSSALYGKDAYLGVINIITKKGKDLKYGSLSLRGGYLNENLAYTSTATTAFNNENIDFVLSGSYTNLDHSGLKIVNIPDNNRYDSDDISKDDIAKSATIFGKLSYKKDKIGTFSLDFNYQHIDKFGDFQDWAVLTHENEVSLYNMYVRGKYDNKWGDLSFQLSATYSKGAPTDSEKLATTDRTIADYIKRDWGYSGIDINGEFKYTFFKKNVVTFGGDFTRDNHTLQTYYTYNDGVKEDQDSLGEKVFSNYGIYLQGIFYPLTSVKSLSKLGITVGLRYDIHNIYDNVFNYRAGLVIPIGDNFYTKLLFGTSFKAPSPDQLYTTLMISGDVLQNPDLKPEKAKTIEFVVGGKFLDSIQFTLVGFYNIIDDKVELVKESQNSKPDNIAEMISYGGEAEIVVKYKEIIKFYTNFSYQKTEITENNETYDNLLYPEIMIKFGLNYTFAKAFLNFNIEGRYIGTKNSSVQNSKVYDSIENRDVPKNPYQIDSFFTVDGVISTHKLIFFGKNETILQIKVSNILDQKIVYPGYRDFDIPDIGRTIWVNFTQEF